MRIGAVTGSIVLHSALIAAAFTLPKPPTRHVQDPVVVDLFTRKAAPKPEEPKPPELPKPEIKPEAKEPRPEPEKVAMREVRPEPEKPEVAPAEPPPSSAPTSDQKPPGKVDLTLHALPSGGSDNSVTVPNGEGTFGGTLGTNGKKPWHVDAGNPLTGKIAAEKEEKFPLTPAGNGEYVYKGKAFHARIMRDGRVSFDDKNIRDFKGLSGGFDVTDLLMKAHHNDPYRYEKQSFMDHTEVLRKKMAQDAYKERVAYSLGQLPHHLDEIWHDTNRPPEKRRALIYDTWLDAAMGEGEASAAGKEACAVIETYVRRYLPNGTEDAFTDDELDRLNRGQKFKFAPYR